jgi:hypothetical protein
MITFKNLCGIVTLSIMLAGSLASAAPRPTPDMPRGGHPLLGGVVNDVNDITHIVDQAVNKVCPIVEGELLGRDSPCFDQDLIRSRTISTS